MRQRDGEVGPDNGWVGGGGACLHAEVGVVAGVGGARGVGRVGIGQGEGLVEVAALGAELGEGLLHDPRGLLLLRLEGDARVRQQGELLDQRLTERFGNHPNIGDIRGRGLFRGLELVADRTTKQPFDPALKLHARVKQAAFDRGLGCYPSGGTVDGVRGDHILLAPPYIVSDDEIDMIVTRLGAAIDDALTGMTA